MEGIEVTRRTFYSIFNNVEGTTEKDEQTERIAYYSQKHNQRGCKVYNFASSKEHQYYLFDINL